MRRTKIVVTLGPATDNEKVLIKLIDAGMNVARCNFSHADYEEHLNRVKMLKKVCKKTGKKVSLLMDTKGPEIRTGHFENGKISLEASNQVTLTTEDVLGNEKLIPVTYAKLPKVVIPGTEILLDDGLINLKVIKIIDNKNVLCEIFNSGEIKDRRGVNIPNFSIDLPNPTDKDKKDIMFAIENDFDYIAVSFVQDSDTILEFKKILRKSGGEKIQVVAKIENYTGVNNFDSILSVADGIMVA
ncbi:MAG: pyruvate kinase, partial [Candidatus Muiribacteriota bacterium]